VNPFMSVKDAARRRDFTINSMSINLVDMTLNDPFNGLKDLQSGVLTATDPALFVQDPLRALRAMQLLARKAKTVDQKTTELVRSMRGSFGALPKERLFEEFKKLLLKAEKPSMGLNFLRASGWVNCFPALAALIGVKQRAEWHSEGDVWVHSLLAVDAAAQVRASIPSSQRLAFMFGALCHDMGKPATTITREDIARARDWNSVGPVPRVIALSKRGKRSIDSLILTAIGHDKAGCKPVEGFLSQLCNNTKLIKLTSKLVETHMRPGALVSDTVKIGAYARLHRELSSVGGDLHLLGKICQCDSCASSPAKLGKSLASGAPNWEHKVSKKMFAANERLQNEGQATPKVMGRDLIKAGLKPGVQFKNILGRALELQDGDESLTTDELIRLATLV
ncbi:MAG: hypothetical protein R8K20_09790, partial [Gallionellaceae bacterium]